MSATPEQRGRVRKYADRISDSSPDSLCYDLRCLLADSEELDRAEATLREVVQMVRSEAKWTRGTRAEPPKNVQARVWMLIDAYFGAGAPNENADKEEARGEINK